jgi:hypothetical protein
LEKALDRYRNSLNDSFLGRFIPATPSKGVLIRILLGPERSGVLPFGVDGGGWEVEYIT